MGAQRIVAAVAVLAMAVLLGWLWLQPGERAQGLAPGADEVAPPQATETALDVPAEAASGPAPAREAVPVESQESVSLEPAAGKRTLRVLVLSAESELPIAGARVTAFEDPPPPPAETDASGRCELQVTPSAETIRLRVEKAGFFHRSAEFYRQERLTIRLERAVTLFGRVVAADTGAPVPQARVSLGHGWCKGCEPDVVVAGPDGIYELPGVPQRSPATFSFDADGFAHQWRTLEIRAPGPRVEVDFRLERGLEVAGRVVDFETGGGIAGAKVAEIVADPSGVFRGRILPVEGERTTHLRVEAAGYCRLAGSLDLDHLPDPLEFRLARGAIVEGVVKDGRGEPVPGVQVFVGEDHLARARAEAKKIRPEPSPLDELPRGWGFETDFSHGETDEQGRFRIENLVPWSDFLELNALGSDSSKPLGRVGGPREAIWAELVIENSRPGTVLGKVWLNGEPLRTAQGRVHWKGATREDDAEIDSGDFHAWVEAGEVSFRVEVNGLPAPIEGSEFTLQVAAGADVPCRVELRVPTRPITGRVTYHDGAPAAGASVDASFPATGEGYWDRLHVSTRTAADGSYALEVSDVEQPYRVEASLDEDHSSVEGVRSGTNGVDLVLVRAGSLLLRFRDARSEALLSAQRFELGWKPVEEPEFRALYPGFMRHPDPDGWYELRLPAGRLDLRAREQLWQSAGYLPALHENVRLEPEEPCRVEFLMRAGAVVELRLAPDQEPLPRDHDVLLLEAERWDAVQYWPERRTWDTGGLDDAFFHRFVRFGEEGTAPIRGLAPGRYRFKVFPGDIAIEPAEVVVGTEPREPLPLRWNWLR